MTKEMFVSSTPHETKAGLVEDDQLAEIYLERENEYTLAGSIYKGRVTRVLPGMQSAFVDIGLERDAFLYVSDFMELQEEEEVDDIPAPRAIEDANASARNEAAAESLPSREVEPLESEPEISSSAPEEPKSNGGERENRDDWRGRRRRRGRRGERMPESKFARPSYESRQNRPERQDYGPPPGYQPIILPGESISKYQRGTGTQASAAAAKSVTAQTEQPVSEAFPNDEPLFSAAQARGLAESPVTEAEPSFQSRAEIYSEPVQPAATASERERDHEDEQLDSSDVATAMSHAPGVHSGHTGQNDAFEGIHVASSPARETVEEEIIEEDEADLAHYVEELEEDAAFEEMEEETRAAGDIEAQPREIAASGEPVPSIASFEEPSLLASESQEQASTEEEPTSEDEDAEEQELEEAQAEAEALLDAEARGNGTVDARVEVRAPSGTSHYQRATRPSFDRRGPRGGRRGGRRFRRNQPQNTPPISELLKEGQEILVQIAKEPIGKKGARITSHIALPGRFLVYMPTVHHTGVSRKISSEEERQRLKRIILSERENGHGGFIVRTAAQGANEDELRADIRFLKGLWNEIKTRAENGKSPALIYHDLNVVERVLRDQVTSDFNTIWVDSEQEYERILRFANRFQPALVKRVKLYTKETPLFEQFGLSEEINKALKSKVWLKSGGYIVINQTEALVAIDVNTGKYVGKTARLEDTIVKTNVDAIKEIVRQIRLRDLGGIIIIDFIDMDERRNRQKVMQALEEALRSDRAPSKVLQFNDFGLVAITRKRVKQSLERTIGAPCPYCQSTGFVKSVTTVSNEIYLEMRKIAKHLEHADVMLRVNPEVAKALKSNNGRALTEMEELTKKTIIVKSDPALHQEQFDIN